MHKIFITGCAKTGTTLVRRLFNAFDLKVYNYDEITVNNFIKSNFNVGKRAVPAVFSEVISEDKIQNQLRQLKDCIIINVVRKKEDVLKSDNGYVTLERYEACMQQAEKYKPRINYTVKYEDLMLDPDKIQREIAEKFELTICHLWSKYPNFIDGWQEAKSTWGGIYKLRPIGAPKD